MVPDVQPAAGYRRGVNDRQVPRGERAGRAHVGTYQAGAVPGVEYVEGLARSPREPEDVTPPPPAEPTPGPHHVAPRVVTPPPAEPRRRRPVSASEVAAGSAPAARPSGTRMLPPVEPDPAGAPPSARRPARERRRRGRPRWGRRILLVLLVLLLALGLLFAYAWSRIEKVDAIPDDHGDAVSAGRVTLLVGSDSREGLSDDEVSAFGTGTVEGRRTDTIMVLHVPTSGDPALISVPRDSLVDIPGSGRSRINAAYAIGGPALLVETFEANTGVAVDDYVEIGFGGFVSIVDAIGGVEMCLDDPIQDARAHIDLPAGCQELAGSDALGLARARYFDPRSDLARVENQQRLMGAIVDQATSPLTLVNPVAMVRLALAGGDALVLDESTGPLDALRFARGLQQVSGGSGTTLTVPLGEVGNTVTWHSEDAPRLWEALREGTTVPDDLTNG